MGRFCLVLHGHLPHVLHHGRWPHGESWVYEGASGSWLPLLQAIEAVAASGGRAGFTLGLTPVLLEQLAHPRFQAGFPAWLDERIGRARQDQRTFRDWGDGHLVYLAERWEQHFTRQREAFDALDRDLPGAFARHWDEGQIELMGSFATHGYAPLLLHDRSIRAQLRVGLATSERILGRRPSSLWLPECAYRPGGRWTPPCVHGDERVRRGVDQILADEGVRCFFVDAHLFQGARSEGVVEGGAYRKVGWDQAGWDTGRAWRSLLEPHLVTTDGSDTGVAALARHPRVSEQVWSGEVGYPGDGRYLEFHKKHGSDGLPYWKITGNKVGLGDKDRYYPEDIGSARHEHAQHFCQVVRSTVADYREATGRPGVVCAPFDAELFGHRWHEGPDFLRDVLLTLHHDPQVEVCTASELLERQPPDKAVWLPEGSWGASGDHRVWWNDELRWTWELEYRAEDRFYMELDRLPWREQPELRRVLTLAARELLLLQASDWPFVVHTKGAVDYGFGRICGHAERYDRLMNLAWKLSEGQHADAADELAVQEVELFDGLFEGLDLEAFCA